MLKKSIILLMIGVLIASCNKSSYETLSNAHDTLDSKNPFKVSEDEAARIAMDFVNEYDRASRTKSSGGRRIANIKALRKNILTKSDGDFNSEPGGDDDDTEELADVIDVEIDTLMYMVNFEDNAGFAIVAADTRTEPVLALIDEGNFDENDLDETEDIPFIGFIDYAVNMEVEDIKNFEDSLSTKALSSYGYNIIYQKAPILQTKWGQRGLYGSLCPNGTAGCGIIAAAQILSHFQTPNSVDWQYAGKRGSSPLHWARIMNDCSAHGGHITPDCYDSSFELSNLMMFLGEKFNAKYKKNQTTSVRTSAPINWFRGQNGINATKLKKYNEKNIVSAITEGKLVYGSGAQGRRRILWITLQYIDGHAWVYDGVISAKRGRKTLNYIHCNWGWNGTKNGYYLSKAFSSNASSTIYEDGESRDGLNFNYKYNLEYSIISR